jgi:sugar (pentulose or hexulose) kinase
MNPTPVIAIFDIGKTNKKLFLFSEEYKIVYEKSVCFDEIRDEDGDPCEDLEQLQNFIFSSLQDLLHNTAFRILAINFSTYGASFVHLDDKGFPVTPLYNYLKVYPEDLLHQFYDRYGGQENFSMETASPVLGHLNSGMQLYWLKHHHPHVYKKISYSLHLPQYVSHLLTNSFFAELTSIGCHTNLWNFKEGAYHDWVRKEGIIDKLAPVVPSTHVVPAAVRSGNFLVGVGMHDSSAALIPYLASFQEPFILISTGTWCISLNPFNDTPLTAGELAKDCLCYLTYQGRPVKASRLFAGNDHEIQVKRLAYHFYKEPDYYQTVLPDPELLYTIAGMAQQEQEVDLKCSLFAKRDLTQFANFEEGYHYLMHDIVAQQVVSTSLVLQGKPVKRIFVDGGFGKNPLYMQLMAMRFPEMEVFAASVAQATAMGVALSVHPVWNTKHLPSEIIELKYYGVVQDV